jgi:hypothetical protein
MALTNKVSDSTLEFLYQRLIEGALVGNIAAGHFISKGAASTWKGSQAAYAFKWTENTNQGSFVGAQLLSNSQVDNTIKLIYQCAFLYQATTLNYTDVALNQTEGEVANLIERQIGSDTRDLTQLVGTQFYAAGSNGQDLLGLAAGVDNGNTVATIGGQSRATYPALDATVNAATLNKLTLAQMYSTYDSTWQGVEMVNHIFTTTAVRTDYQQLLDPIMRFEVPTNAAGRSYNLGLGGTKALQFNNASVWADMIAPANVMWFINDMSMEFQYLPEWPEGKPVKFAEADIMDGEPDPELAREYGFHWTEFVRPVNQMIMSGFTVLAGNMIYKNPRYNAQLNAISAGI